MKAEARRFLTRFLKDLERHQPDGAGFEWIPELTPGQWRTVAAALAAYRATIDEKLIEDEMRRPRISLSDIPAAELRELCQPTVIEVKKNGRSAG